MNIGVICPSEIALRRFMPALQSFEDVKFIGIGVSSVEERFGPVETLSEEQQIVLDWDYARAKVFIENYGGAIFDSYEALVSSDEIDAVYIPLPPALHFKWTKTALEYGKHVLVEKPSTISFADTKELVRIASDKNLALHENYMFAFHSQLDEIDEIIKSGEIGDVRLYRIYFGFPLRAANDFRYNKTLGGGALIDAGGYTLKYANRLLGPTAKFRFAQKNYIDGFEVDMYGAGALTNDDGHTVQIAFGMDNSYKCELEVWGSHGCLTTGRVLTAPAGFAPTVIIRKGSVDEERMLSADDAFGKSIRRFLDCVCDSDARVNNYKEIVRQAEMVEEFSRLAD